MNEYEDKPDNTGLEDKAVSDSWDWVSTELRKLEDELSPDSGMLEVVDAISVADFWKRRYDEESTLWERKLQIKEEEKSNLKEKTQSHEIALKELEWKLKELDRRWQQEKIVLEDRLKSKETEAELQKIKIQWEMRLAALEEENKHLKSNMPAASVAPMRPSDAGSTGGSFYPSSAGSGVAEAKVRELEERLRQAEEEYRKSLKKLDEEKETVKRQLDGKEDTFRQEKAAWETLEKEVSQLNRQMIDRLKLLREREQDHFTVLEDLARGFAHRVRNYLGIISGTIQLCVANYKMDEELKGQLVIVDQNVADMLKSIEEFLALARIPQMSSVKMSLASVVDKALSAAADKFKAVGISVEKNFADAPEIDIDEKLMSEALGHLFSNAAEAMSGGGNLTVSLSYDNAKSLITLKIADTGAGVSETHLKKIFQPYFTTKKNRKGLGLTSAKRIADLHGATLALESVKGKGSVVSIVFLVK